MSRPQARGRAGTRAHLSAGGSARRRALAIAALSAATLALGACGPPAGAISEWELTPAQPAAVSDVDQITWAVHAEPYSLDYAYAFDYPDNMVLANVCESLLRMKPDLSLEPGLATSFSNPTPTTWVYEIRDGVTFHDGSPLTADDVVASLSRHLDPEVGSFWYSVYQNVDSIEKTGPRQVTVTTRVPDSQFNLAMGNSSGVIESAKTLEEKGKDYGNSTGGVNCTGPFQFSKWTSGESIKLTRYDGYWRKEGRAHSSELDFVFMPDGTARTNALKAGEVDGTWMVPPEAVPILRAGSGGDVFFGTNATVNSLVVSDLKGPFGDLKVRQALAYALDRAGILGAGYGGYGEVTDALTTRSVWQGVPSASVDAAFTGLNGYPRDLEKAKALIKEAGVEGQEVVIATAPISNDFTVTAQATADALNQIGLKATIKTVTPNAYTTLFSDPSAREGVDLFYTSWYLSSPDALEMYGVLRTGEFSNYGGWDDPEFNRVVNQATATMDATQRAALTAKAQKIANEQLPWIPLFAPPTTAYLSDRLTGLSPSINFMYAPWAAALGAR
ncbi:ABC transporter substrate-binding protein [Galactobacter valiniphilus]|uniref:ABC transporter substrate-binding protein n=1 Tax=Galactobacter valiniphilus TaxID=2676122 RepID=A0A399JJ49_9MICC|nr:ABC transporter substrate-binding protein [Galactobacter valiniphilus]RII42476.1 ABC transporter substrate-binding protein [Galactobacter valiniphilus]